ncbi:shikimate kinase [Paenibacillus lycopersici]|uniref:Shikimate kinase n=1 Tax=Paenibacillus lycopersici TaxID=2704462 RepID=A0A6C0FS41_9BACL|nr:shikimate kinase [Paenibacillus lycopersici]QHT59677.1 shikimate kinase [Paenibacillus lycopersici]
MNIVLIGMSGAGKSTLGVLLAKALGMDFVDTDIVIQQQEGRLLQDIIDRDGIAHFMAVEERIVSGLRLDNSIVSTGGSVVYSEQAMHTLRQGGRIVYLHVPYEEIERRIGGMAARGIVMKSGQCLRDVYDERMPLYVKYGDMTVDCTNKAIESCVGEIIACIRERA